MMATDNVAKWAIFCLMLIFFVFATALAVNPEDELKQLLDQIDASLVTQSHSDFNLWHQYVGKDVHGVLWSLRRESLAQNRDFSYKPLLTEGAVKLDMKHGCAVQEAATLFRAYEITANQAYLESGLKFCEFLLRAQNITGGYWARTYILDADGQISIPGASFTGKVREGETPIIRSSWLSAEEKTCRLQDHYQSRPFYLLLYAYRLTGEQRYFNAAKQVADVVLSIQNKNGSWPDEWDFSLPPCEGPQSTQRGVRLGGSFNDRTTSDGLRMMLQMYLLTGNKKYISRVPALGQCIFDTRMGQDPVIGWCQQYGLDNKPVPARHFEMPVIEPRTFSRFIAPLCGWYYALTGEERYYDLLRKSYFWLRSVEQTNGWAYQYLADGSPVFSHRFQVYRMDEPETWANDEHFSEMLQVKKYKLSRDIVNLKCAKQVLHLIESGGREKLREAINGRSIHEEHFLSIRMAAARRAIVAQKEPDIASKWSLPENKKVHWENIMPKLQYVFDVLLADGLISREYLQQTSRGYQWPHFYEKWQVLGDWTQYATPIEDWLAIPIGQY